MIDEVHTTWSDMLRWDFKSAKAAAFRRANPDFRPFGEFVEEATEIVDPRAEPYKAWAFYGVNNRDGVFYSDLRLGSEFNQTCKRIRKDWFFHNPTRANVGSLGRVPEVDENAITSPEYQVWRVVNGMTPDFVEIFIRTPYFLDMIRWHRVGAVKERLFVENLLEIPVPVIVLDEQARLVQTVQLARERVAQARRDLAAVEKEVAGVISSMVREAA